MVYVFPLFCASFIHIYTCERREQGIKVTGGSDSLIHVRGWNRVRTTHKRPPKGNVCHLWPVRMWNFFLGATLSRGSHPSDSLLSRSEGLGHVEWASTDFMVASGRVLSEGYGHDGPGVCLRTMARRSTVARWTGRRAAPTYTHLSIPTTIPDLR